MNFCSYFSSPNPPIIIKNNFCFQLFTLRFQFQNVDYVDYKGWKGEDQTALPGLPEDHPRRGSHHQVARAHPLLKLVKA